MGATPNPATEASLSSVAAQLDQIAGQLATLVERQRAIEELVDELAPIARLAMDGAIEKLQSLEEAGYFTLGREALRVADRIVRAYSPDDVRRLGDQVVGIVDTVRNLTQPDMLAMMNEVAGVVHGADESDPKGMWGMMRASKDPDVRKGMGVMVAVLKQIGKASDAIAKSPVAAPPVRVAAYAGTDGTDGKSGASWMRHLAPRRAMARPELPPPPSAGARTATGAAHCVSALPAKPAFGGGVALPPGYGPDGFLTDPALWSRELATALAALVPVALTDAHWTVIDWARGERAATGVSPNIRRVSVGTGVAIRDLYALFPSKPGVLIAMLAGIPKPAGCL